jgi:hypothetical protein
MAFATAESTNVDVALNKILSKLPNPSPPRQEAQPAESIEASVCRVLPHKEA